MLGDLQLQKDNYQARQKEKDITTMQTLKENTCQTQSG